MGDFGNALDVFRANRRIWETKIAPTTLVRDAHERSLVTIAGILAGESTLRAALTLEPCLAYRIRCGERRDDLGMTQFFATEGARAPFVVVDDEGGRVRVDDAELLIGAAFTDVSEVAMVEEGNGVLPALIGPKLATRAIDVARRRRGVFLEDRFVPGERVVVRGFLEETTEVVIAGYRNAVGRALRLRATDHPVVLCRP
jgi:hypothetical protein